MKNDDILKKKYIDMKPDDKRYAIDMLKHIDRSAEDLFLNLRSTMVKILLLVHTGGIFVTLFLAEKGSAFNAIEVPLMSFIFGFLFTALALCMKYFGFKKRLPSLKEQFERFTQGNLTLKEIMFPDEDNVNSKCNKIDIFYNIFLFLSLFFTAIGIISAIITVYCLFTF